VMTPALSFSEVAIAENVRRLNELAADSHRVWAAALTHLVPVGLLRDLVLPVTKYASCYRIDDAEHLADAGFEKMILTGRVVDSESLRRLQRIAVRTQVIVVIDHFRHAELLSPWAVQSGCEIQVLIEVDTGRQSIGVRPGPDASLLATAATQLPGLKVIGIFALAHDPHAEHEHGDVDAELTATITIAEHALRSIRGVSAACRETVISVSTLRRPSMQDARISCLVMSPFVDFAVETPLAAHQPCVSLIATVISRPTLERCVINAGTNAFGNMSDVRIHAPTGATILNSTSETSTLQISGEACDLRIGDPVRMTVGNPERLLNRVWLS
jgi:D-serine deaminase-like pyridoxal phosphate-dependent protein